MRTSNKLGDGVVYVPNTAWDTLMPNAFNQKFEFGYLQTLAALLRGGVKTRIIIVIIVIVVGRTLFPCCRRGPCAHGGSLTCLAS